MHHKIESNKMLQTDLLNKLFAVTQKDVPLFGKMSVQHMIEHLILALHTSNGKLAVECFTPAEKLPTLKRILLSERPLPKGFVNPLIGEGLLELKYSTLDEAKEMLKIEIKDYELYFEMNPETLFVHPVFGSLNKEEWDIFHRKHFIHHMQQFGLM